MIERSRVRVPAGTAGEFSFPGSTFGTDILFQYPFQPGVTAIDPGHSAKSAGGRLQLNGHAPYVASSTVTL